jgi:hypothetical protein
VLVLATSAIALAAACAAPTATGAAASGLTGPEQQLIGAVGPSEVASGVLVKAGYDACTSLNSNALDPEAAVQSARKSGSLDDPTARAVVRAAADTLCPAASVVGLSPIPPRATAAAPATQPAAAKQVHTGQGNGVVTLATPVQVGILEFSCPKCSDTVVVKSDASIDPDLVNRFSNSGPYSGKRWMGLRGDTTTRLQVTAQGAWTLTVGGLDMARQVDPANTATGSGDDVVLYKIAPSTVTATHRGTSNFAVWVMSDKLSSPDLAVNETGSYDGTVMFPSPGEAALVQVQADGKWTLTPKV